MVGENVKNWFPNINVDKPSNPQNLQNNGGILRESNILSNIPKRFAKTTLSASSVPFLDELKAFCLAPSDKVFILTGSVGTGKTTSMIAAMHERALNGLNSGLYFTMRMLPASIRTCRSFSAKENEEDFITRFSTTPFLCLDELGSSEDSNLEQNFVRTILALRYDNMLPTMIATNFAWEALKEFLTKGIARSDEIIDRLKSITTVKALTGESKRGK